MTMWPRSFLRPYRQHVDKSSMLVRERVQEEHKSEAACKIIRTGTVRNPVMANGSAVPTIAGKPCVKYQLQGFSP